MGTDQLWDFHLGITDCGTHFPQCGVHRTGKGVLCLELVLTGKKKQPAMPGMQRAG